MRVEKWIHFFFLPSSSLLLVKRKEKKGEKEDGGGGLWGSSEESGAGKRQHMTYWEGKWLKAETNTKKTGREYLIALFTDDNQWAISHDSGGGGVEGVLMSPTSIRRSTQDAPQGAFVG